MRRLGLSEADRNGRCRQSARARLMLPVALPTLVIMKWERKWEPVLLSQAPWRFVLLGPAACDLG